MLEKMATFQSRGSGWKLHSIVQLDIYTVRCSPTSGETYIPLPKALGNKKAIINMKNKDDNKCFLWCVLRALNPKEDNSDRVDTELRGKADTLNMKGIKYPVSLKDLGKFGKTKPVNIHNGVRI